MSFCLCLWRLLIKNTSSKWWNWWEITPKVKLTTFGFYFNQWLTYYMYLIFHPIMPAMSICRVEYWFGQKSFKVWKHSNKVYAQKICWNSQTRSEKATCEPWRSSLLWDLCICICVSKPIKCSSPNLQYNHPLLHCCITVDMLSTSVYSNPLTLCACRWLHTDLTPLTVCITCYCSIILTVCRKTYAFSTTKSIACNSTQVT